MNTADLTIAGSGTRAHATGPITMTSREIAELTGKHHKDVLYDIRCMLDQLGMHSADFSAQYKDSTGRTLPMFTLPKDLTLTLIAGYSVPLRHRIVTRWQELEADAADPVKVLSDPSKLRQVLLGYTEKVLALEHQVVELAPKAAALDRISASEEAVTMTQAAKELGIKRETLTNYLKASGWVYRQNGTWVPYDQHIKNGRLQFKEARYTDQKTGQECHKPYCHIMPRGLALLAQHFAAKGGV